MFGTTKRWRRAWMALTVAAALAAGMVGSAGAARPAEGRRTYQGVIDGAAYKVEMPARWNGTVVLYSHPYYTAEMGEFPIGHANRAETEGWLLEHGYALAASDFKGRNGFVVEEALADQTALLDWFTATIGRPRRTIATGSSGGGAIAVLLAERNPGRIDGVMAMCGPLDLYGQWNLSLDVNFAIKTLLAPGQDIDLTGARDPAGGVTALLRAVGSAVETKEGRARLALANAFGNVEGWNSAHDPKPATVEGQIRAMAEIDQGMMIYTFGPTGQAELAQRAGGNPTWNVGVDYRRQLARSSQLDLVRKAYRAAGLDLQDDLDQLAAAPRISPDPAAVRWMDRYAVPRGTTPSPVITLHNTVDAAVADHERWYAGQVRRHGDSGKLRQVFVGRATHCAFTAAEEIVTLRALLQRVESGRWPDQSDRRLNAEAGELGAEYQKVYNHPTGDAVRPPAFTRFAPQKPLRPTH